MVSSMCKISSENECPLHFQSANVLEQEFKLDLPGGPLGSHTMWPSHMSMGTCVGKIDNKIRMCISKLDVWTTYKS